MFARYLGNEVINLVDDLNGHEVASQAKPIQRCRRLVVTLEKMSGASRKDVVSYGRMGRTPCVDSIHVLIDDTWTPKPR